MIRAQTIFRWYTTVWRDALNVGVQFVALTAICLSCGCAGKTGPIPFEVNEPILREHVQANETARDDSLPDPFDLTQLDELEIVPVANTSAAELNQMPSVLEDVSYMRAADRPVWRTLFDDQREFYIRQNVRPAIFTLGAAAILANTTMDQEFSDWYQDDVRSESLDDIAEVAKLFGEQWPMVGLYAGSSVLGRWLDVDPRFAEWGDQSLRSMFVGVPPLLFLQRALGSSRPNDVPPSSKWNFWNDDNGASGHTFVGAVPFLVAGRLAQRPRVKATWYAMSTLTGWSRINDNDHYLSQVIIGWWLAYAATEAVERSEHRRFEVAPALIDDTIGIEATWQR